MILDLDSDFGFEFELGLEFDEFELDLDLIFLLNLHLGILSRRVGEGGVLLGGKTGTLREASGNLMEPRTRSWFTL